MNDDEVNLLEAMELGEFEKNEVLDHLNALKLLKRDSEDKLNNLRKTRDYLTSLSSAQVKVDELYQRVIDNLKDATPEIKAMALDALDIKVRAKGTDDVQINGVIPLELTSPTTEQTLA